MRTTTTRSATATTTTTITTIIIIKTNKIGTYCSTDEVVRFENCINPSARLAGDSELDDPNTPPVPDP